MSSAIRRISFTKVPGAESPALPTALEKSAPAVAIPNKHGVQIWQDANSYRHYLAIRVLLAIIFCMGIVSMGDRVAEVFRIIYVDSREPEERPFPMLDRIAGFSLNERKRGSSEPTKPR